MKTLFIFHNFSVSIFFFNFKILEDREKWVKYALSLRLKNSTVMLNTSTTYHLAIDPLLAQFKGSCNVWEAAITIRLLEVLEEVS